VRNHGAAPHHAGLPLFDIHAAWPWHIGLGVLLTICGCCVILGVQLAGDPLSTTRQRIGAAASLLVMCVVLVVILTLVATS
jgi:hypothetical protein